MLDTPARVSAEVHAAFPGEGGGGTQFVHGRSRMTIDPRIPVLCRDGARRLFTKQADIPCTKREAP